MIRISIITPVYNRADCIVRCMESVQTQTYENYEHIIVDDGSMDGTYDKVCEYASCHSNIITHRLPHNKGTNAARNAAVGLASGEYILLLDSDDKLCDNALNVIAATIERSLESHTFLHYLFEADDGLSVHNGNVLFKNEQSVVCYENWIKGEIEYDFIHVIAKPVMDRFPFDERTRVYENVTFLKFHRFTQQQLYTKLVVVSRDRQRTDSALLTIHPTNLKRIEQRYYARKTLLDSFYSDYLKYGLKNKVVALIRETKKLALILSRYDDYEKLSSDYPIIRGGGYDIISSLHCGFLLRWNLMMMGYLRSAKNMLKVVIHR